VDADPTLRRVERTAIMICLGMMVPALALAGIPAAAGVLGGGIIAALSYWTLASSVTALTTSLAGRAGEDGAPAPPRSTGWTLVKAGSRYALLALLAYVMIARLRLHPLGLLAGVSSVVAAITIEGVRLVLKKP
jgi:hypothetical protein